jgi:hypothetical protein
MKTANQLVFKVLALGIAVGLGGGYVWKRQKSAATPPPPPLEVKAAEAQEPPKADSEVMLMPSSKTIILDTPISPQPLIRDPKTLMPSSKSGAFILDPPGTTEPTPPTVEQRKLLLSGSKSGILIEPEPETKLQTQEQKKP